MGYVHMLVTWPLMKPSPGRLPAKSMDAKSEVGRYCVRKVAAVFLEVSGAGEATVKVRRAAMKTIRHQRALEKWVNEILTGYGEID